MLDGLHAPRREAAAVADAVDLVDDRRGHVARQQEVGMQRVRHAALDRAARGDHRLADHLAAEDAASAEIARDAAEEIFLQRFEVEHREQVGQHLRGREVGQGGGAHVGHDFWADNARMKGSIIRVHSAP